MLVIAFFQWWYGPGWRDASRRVGARIKHTYLDFSVPILLRTLFSPWRRIIAPSSNNIGQMVRGLVDNTVSRFVGFTVRLIALAAALILMALTFVFGSLLVVLWPLLPLLGLGLIVSGVAL